MSPEKFDAANRKVRPGESSLLGEPDRGVRLGVGASEKPVIDCIILGGSERDLMNCLNPGGARGILLSLLGDGGATFGGCGLLERVSLALESLHSQLREA